MGKRIVIAADWGASGGKMAKGSFDGERVQVDDFYDFPNQPMELNQNLYWDLFSLYNHILEGMIYYGRNHEVASVGIDAWGASYGLLDKRGRLLEPVYHYRDMRTEKSMERMFQKISKRSLFQLTGCQPNRTYTLPQLYSYVEHGDRIIELADKMLFLPDLIEYFLTGTATTERSIAGTSGMMKPGQDGWEYKVMDALGIPTNMLTDIVDAGTIRGYLTDNVSNRTGIGKTKVVATVGHDTATAVAGIPDFGMNQVYISIGTNINMGIELGRSVIGERAFKGGFKNAGVLEERKIVYRDFSACWLLNELIRTCSDEGITYTHRDIMDMVQRCESKRVYIDVEEEALNNAGGSIKQKINNYLAQTCQEQLDSNADFARCIMESIALKIKFCTEYLKNELHIPVKKVSVVNGATRNYVLMQIISEALGERIFCGMPYATLMGNVLVQFYALGEISSVDEIRQVAGRSFKMKEYIPKQGTAARWNEDLQNMLKKGVMH